MARRWRQFTALAVGVSSLALLAGCQNRVIGFEPPPASWPTRPAVMAVIEAPKAPPVPLKAPPELAGDAEALRFLALARLVEGNVVRPEEADVRRSANLGALLPYTMPPPAAGLARPAPLQAMMDTLADLSVQPGSAPLAQMALVLDSLLPREPKARTVPARTDSAALKLGRDRIVRLARAELVSPDEKQREEEAIDRAEQVLASQPPAPPPQAPPKKKKPARKKAPAAASTGAEAQTPPPRPADPPGGAQPPPAANTAQVGLHLLSMASDTMTDKAVDALKKEHPELGALTFKAVKTDIPDLGTTYRLLAGPLPRAEAAALCKALAAKGQSCALASY